MLNDSGVYRFCWIYGTLVAGESPLVVAELLPPPVELPLPPEKTIAERKAN